MELLPKNFHVKATVRKVLEVTFSSNKGLDLKAALEKGPVKATVNSEGKIEYTGKIGKHYMNGDPSLQALGKKYKNITIEFKLDNNGDIVYVAKVNYLKALEFSVDGSFDIEEFLFSDGTLRWAYDGLINHNQQTQEEIKKIRGK